MGYSLAVTRYMTYLIQQYSHVNCRVAFLFNVFKCPGNLLLHRHSGLQPTRCCVGFISAFVSVLRDAKGGPTHPLHPHLAVHLTGSAIFSLSSTGATVVPIDVTAAPVSL
jgi:hypothetical protein